MDYVISLATPADTDACLSLARRMAPAFSGLTPDTLRHLLTAHIAAGQAVCARLGCDAIGFLLFSAADNAVLLLAVDPARRNKPVSAGMLGCMAAALPKSWRHKPVMGPDGQFVPAPPSVCDTGN